MAVNIKDYLSILANHDHPIIQTLFPDGYAIFQNDNAPIYMVNVIQNWYEENKSELGPLDDHHNY